MTKRIEKYCKLWNLTLEKEVKAFCGKVYLGKKGETPIVLKLPNPNSDEILQGKILRHYNGNGCARLIASDKEAILIERILPGRHLTELVKDGRDDQATKIFCQTAKQLHSAPCNVSMFKPVADFAGSFDRYLKRDDNIISASEVLYAKELFDSLVKSQSKPILLHADLHHDNILQDDIRGWLAIDPKGYVGEPMYEAGLLLRNPIPHIKYFAAKEIINKRVKIIVQEMGWNRERILNWTYVQAILSTIWSIEDKQSTKASLAVAAVLKEMI